MYCKLFIFHNFVLISTHKLILFLQLLTVDWFFFSNQSLRDKSQLLRKLQRKVSTEKLI